MNVTIYDTEWNRETSRKNGTKSHDLLRVALETFLGTPVEEWSVLRDSPYAKPYVPALPNVHFSITHAGDYWACAVADAEVGLDLQDVRERIAGSGTQEDRAMAIARRFFHPAEVAYLEGRPAEEFFRLWAKKESYVKYTGAGLTGGLDFFSVVDGAPAPQCEVPFYEGYFLVLTSAEEACVRREQLWLEDWVDGEVRS